MAPEALKAGYDKKADVFSFGVVMYVEAAHAVSVPSLSVSPPFPHSVFDETPAVSSDAAS